MLVGFNMRISDHPDLGKLLEKKVQNAVSTWKLAKYSRDEYHLPVGPKSINKRE